MADSCSNAVAVFLRQPAIKLLKIFRGFRAEEPTQAEAQPKGSLQVREAVGMANFSTAKAQRVRKTLAHMQPVGDLDTYA